MNQNFPRLLTLVRKEKKLSQKEAAKALGISQALLSHYENGIRECGLDFLTRAADFYQVSCDYLLGRSTSRFGVIPSDIQSNNYSETVSVKEFNILHQSLNLISEILKKCDSKDLATTTVTYIKIFIYKIFRAIYSANSKNPQNLFHINKHLYRSTTDAKILILENQINLLAQGKAVPGLSGIARGEAPSLSMDTLAKENAADSEAIQSVIKDIENL